jgi:hypothetical protein
MRIRLSIARPLPQVGALLADRSDLLRDAVAKQAKGGAPRAHGAALSDNLDAKTDSILRVFDSLAPLLSGSQLIAPLS